MVIFPVAESREEQGLVWKVSVGVLCGFVLGWAPCFHRSQMSSDPWGEEEGMHREDLPYPAGAVAH